MSEMNSRRQFVKIALGISGLALIAPKIAFGQQERRRGGGGAGAAPAAGDKKTLVKPGEGLAANLHYVEKKSDIKDPALKADKGGVSFDKQKCSNCMFYTADGKVDGQDVGKCTLFQNLYVKGEGWCNSWAKKA